MKQSPATIISSREAMPGTYLLRIRSPRVASGANPGQFVMVRCGEENELPLRRPLSIHRIESDSLALLFNTVGKGTRWLSQRQKDDAIDIIGPLGNGFTIHTESRQILLLAGGMGIVPLVYLADIALKQEKRVTLLAGARSAAQLLPEERLPRGFTIVTATEDGTQGYQGYVSELLPDYADRSDQIFACGPTAMYREMAQRKRELGLEGKPVQISLEMRMGCGLGVCYACTVRTRSGLKQVCQDGPVFELDDIIWNELIPD
ncbi:MAG: dihydroorotate dehydrogenase electron transfer subunit [Dehalococcoidales bacterium]|nr:dihydroorotate dehydrogenase electron transfer subunit [Dehalococcoidales bacterium]